MLSREFKVSVIIPVYNAEKYLTKAVESAVGLAEVAEVILIEDNSPDNALQLAFKLEQKYDKVKLYQHSDKSNQGAGASRNLGIRKASFEYISFLDADDYYLPERFKKDQELFEKIPDCDGVYNSVGTYFYSEEAKNNFFENGFGYQEVLNLTDEVAPDDLFAVLFNQHSTVTGQFHTNGITLKKKVFKKVGDFNTDLRLRQDIHLWRRLAAFCQLYAGELSKPVAMRGIHESNRMTRKKDHEKYIDIWWQSLKSEFKNKHLQKTKMDIFELTYTNHYSGSKNKLLAVQTFLISTLKRPKLIMESNSHFDFNFWKVFGKNRLTLHIISFKNKIVS